MTQQPSAEKKFRVRVKKISQSQAVVEAHGQEIVLSTQGSDSNAGITAPETVLAAFGTCIVSNINKAAAQEGAAIDDVAVEFEAKKRLDPLGLDGVRYVVTIESSAPADQLRRIYEKATLNGTATNALREGISAEGKLVLGKMNGGK